MAGYTVKTHGGSVRLSRGFRIVYTCDTTGDGCVIWRPDASSGFALTLFTSLSGNGKSTFLLKLYSRLRGEIDTKDPNLWDRLSKWIAERRGKTPTAEHFLSFDFTPDYNHDVSPVGYVPQHAPMVRHWKMSDILPRNPRFLECFLPGTNVDTLFKKHFGEFSGGQRNKLYTCSVIERLAENGTRPAFLLLDETFDGLGAFEAGRCLAAIRSKWIDVVKRPLHILLVTHINNDELISKIGTGISVEKLSLQVTKDEEREKASEIFNRP